jgi:glutaredoxin
VRPVVAVAGFAESPHAPDNEKVAGRCVEHGLATGPDGRCALCRRSVPPRSAPPPSSVPRRGATGAVGLLVGALGALSLGLVSWLLAGAPQPWDESSRAAVPASELPRAASPGADDGAEQAARAARDRELAAQIAKLEAQQQTAAADQGRQRERELERRRLEREQARIDAQMEQTRAAMERRELERKRRGLSGARAQVEITMYSTSWCSACKAARKYMDAQGIAYTDHDVEQDPAARETKDFLNPKGSVPTINVGGVVMVGFSPGHLERLIDAAARREAGLPRTGG